VLDLLVKSAIRRKTIGLFSLNPNYDFYAQEVAKEIDEAPFAVGLELQYLTKGGLLKKVKKGRRFYYRWNEGYPYAQTLRSTVEKMCEQGNPEMKNLPSLERREEIERNLQKVLEGLKKYYDPEKVILFGSAVTGKVGPHSDIDMVVIKKTPLNYFERVEQLVDLVDYDIDIDFLVYTPEEFERAVRERRFFQEEIVKRGKILYEKAA